MGCRSKATSVQHASRARSPFLPAASTWHVQNADEWLSLAAPPEFRVDRSDRESMCELRIRRIGWAFPLSIWFARRHSVDIQLT